MPIAVPGRQIPLSAVRDASGAVYDAAVRTPLVRVDLSDLGGPVPEVYLKLEVLQPIGSFKIRGAYNVLRQLTSSQLKEGVWTVSAGNAAQGVALAARTVGARCSVMVMDTAPDAKIRAIERLGATIVRAGYDECWRRAAGLESHQTLLFLKAYPFRPREVGAGSRKSGQRYSRGVRCTACVEHLLGSESMF